MLCWQLTWCKSASSAWSALTSIDNDRGVSSVSASWVSPTSCIAAGVCWLASVGRRLAHAYKITNWIIISKLLKHHSKAKHRAPAYSRVLREIRGVIKRIVLGRFRSGCQRVRGQTIALQSNCPRSLWVVSVYWSLKHHNKFKKCYITYVFPPGIDILMLFSHCIKWFL